METRPVFLKTPRDFEDWCFEEFKKKISDDRKLFEILLEYARIGYGIYVEGSDGANLFLYNVLPKAERLKRYLGVNCPPERLGSFFLDYNNSSLWVGGEASISQLALMVVARNGYQHFNEDAEPFSVTESGMATVKQFNQMLGLLEGKLLPAWQLLRTWQEESRNGNGVATSPIELLAIESFLVETRKITYRTKTQGDLNWFDIRPMVVDVVRRVEEYLQFARRMESDDQLSSGEKDYLVELVRPRD